MSFRTFSLRRVAASLVVLLVVSACDDNRAVPLSAVEIIDIPVVDTGPQANQNINNPTLVIPETFPVADGDELTLVFSEEFDGPEIDPEVWFFATGDGTEKGLPGGWGNNELQYYLPDNAMIVNGVLEITARRETVGDLNYTSARINTEDRFAFKYGRIEASIKMPSGQGLWPAFWMLSQDSDYECDTDGRRCIWAATGEIDIVEAINLDGTNGNEIFATIHYGGEFPGNRSSSATYTPSVDVTESFNTYAIEWGPDQIRWYINGLLYAAQDSNVWSSTALNGGPSAPFDQNFHILLNLAVGGNFPGSPNGTTPFPATMEVDWVRVYSGEPPPSEPVDPDPVVFADDFGAGVSFAEFGDSVNAISVDTTEMYAGTASLKVEVPAGGYTGGALVVDPGRDVSSYDTLTFWAKASAEPRTLNVAGIGNDGVDTTNATEVTGLALTTAWQQFTITIPDPSVLTANTGLFHFAEGSDEGAYTIWFDDITYEVAGSGGPGAGDIAVNGGFEDGDFTGWAQFEVVPGDQTVVTTNPRTGTYAGRINNTTPASASLFKQANLTPVAIGQTATITFSARGSLVAGGVAFAEFFTEIDPEGVSSSQILGGAPLALNGDPTVWTDFEFVVDITTEVSNGVTLQLTGTTGGDQTSVADVYYDDIAIVISGGG